MRNFLVLLLTFVALGLSGCGYKTFQAAEENVQVAWSEVLNQYQRRCDLVPELVNAVKGTSASEQDTIVAVTNALTGVSKIKATADVLNNPWAFVRFVEAQARVTSALSRLRGIFEKYPDLKANVGYRALQAELEDTESRIATARDRYIEAAQSYNATVRTFWGTANLLHYSVKPTFSAGAEKAIVVFPEGRHEVTYKSPEVAR